MQVLFLSAPALRAPTARSRRPPNRSSPPNSPPCSATVKARWFPLRNMCSPRCAAWASTTPPSKSTAPKFRSWTAARLHSSPRSTRPASWPSRRFAASSRFSSPSRSRSATASARLRPYAAGFRAEVEIDFANPVIGQQSYTLDLSPERFRREISRARTFGCMNDVAASLERRFRARRLLREFGGVRR